MECVQNLKFLGYLFRAARMQIYQVDASASTYQNTNPYKPPGIEEPVNSKADQSPKSHADNKIQNRHHAAG